MTTADLAGILTCPVEGPEAEITGAAPVDAARRTDLAFVAAAKFFPAAAASEAGCVVAPHDYVRPPAQSVIRSESPRAVFARALSLLYSRRVPQPGVHPSSQIDFGAAISASAEIGPFCTVGSGSMIGPDTRLSPGCHIGRDVHIGAHCVLHPGVIIYDGVKLGDHVVLHAGCVLGADGFGFVPQGGQWIKFPQVGHVEIGNDVEIGANSCVDRAALGVTRIGEGSKLDNLVHVAHNCDIGKHVVVAAQTGFSGGVVVGDHAVIGGQVGVGDKARIAAGVVIGSGAGVLTSKVLRGKTPFWGTPARPLKEYLRQLALLGKLPDLLAEVKALRRRLDEIDKRESENN